MLVRVGIGNAPPAHPRLAPLSGGTGQGAGCLSAALQLPASSGKELAAVTRSRRGNGLREARACWRYPTLRLAPRTERSVRAGGSTPCGIHTSLQATSGAARPEPAPYNPHSYSLPGPSLSGPGPHSHRITAVLVWTLRCISRCLPAPAYPARTHAPPAPHLPRLPHLEVVIARVENGGRRPAYVLVPLTREAHLPPRPAPPGTQP